MCYITYNVIIKTIDNNPISIDIPPDTHSPPFSLYPSLHVILPYIEPSSSNLHSFNLSSSSIIEHEATVSRISEEKLFYLMSRGISLEKAKELLIMGFIEKFKEELPMEYAVELNSLMKKYF